MHYIGHEEGMESLGRLHSPAASKRNRDLCSRSNRYQSSLSVEGRQTGGFRKSSPSSHRKNKDEGRCDYSCQGGG